jgi:hypothetical protein
LIGEGPDELVAWFVFFSDVTKTKLAALQQTLLENALDHVREGIERFFSEDEPIAARTSSACRISTQAFSSC